MHEIAWNLFSFVVSCFPGLRVFQHYLDIIELDIISKTGPFWLTLTGTARLTYIFTRDYPGKLRQSLKFRETASLTLKNAVFKPVISFYVWVHISQGKTCFKNPKICGPSK